MKPPKKDRYIIRKYVMARSAQEAIRLDKITKPADVWIDDEWKNKHETLASAVGFDDGHSGKDSFDDEE